MSQLVVFNSGSGMGIGHAEDAEIMILPEDIDVGEFAVEGDDDGLRDEAFATFRFDALLGVVRALRVITTTPHIADYLAANDPKALTQANDALAESFASHVLDPFGKAPRS